MKIFKRVDTPRPDEEHNPAIWIVLVFIAALFCSIAYLIGSLAGLV